MTPDEVLDCRYELLYRAEYSTRYHRRRAAFLGNLDTLLNVVTLAAGASAFGDLASGAPGWLARIGTAVVALISIGQIVLRLGTHATDHGKWLERWSALHSEMSLNTKPTEPHVKRWMNERTKLETECVGELRALCWDCENAAARVMSISGRQVEIKPLQRMLIHFGTFQRKFPRIPNDHGGGMPVADTDG